MSQWFKDRRQEFIYATLRQFGQVQRGDLMRQFGISMPQAAIDIREFLAKEPPFVSYDVTAKAYVLNEPPAPECRCGNRCTADIDHEQFCPISPFYPIITANLTEGGRA